jgi:hypothetical protein
MPTVKVTVTCECGALIGDYDGIQDVILPYWCAACESDASLPPKAWRIFADDSEGMPVRIDAPKLVALAVAACQSRGVAALSALFLFRQVIGTVTAALDGPASAWPAWLRELDAAVTAQVSAFPPQERLIWLRNCAVSVSSAPER